MKTIKFILAIMILFSAVGCVSNVTVDAKAKKVCPCKCVSCVCNICKSVKTK